MLHDSRIGEQYTGNKRCLNEGLPRYMWTEENRKKPQPAQPVSEMWM